MTVRGYLVYVPFENVASMEYGSNGQPDKATVATEPGKLAGPFEVRRIVKDERVPPHGRPVPGSPEWEERTRELREKGFTEEADARDRYRDRAGAT